MGLAPNLDQQGGANFGGPSSYPVNQCCLPSKVKGFLPPDSGSSGPQVERTDETEVVKKPSSSGGNIAGFPRGVTS